MSEADLEWFRVQDDRIHIVPVEDPDSNGAAEARNAISRLASNEDWIITTRLDSDDVLHRDHLRKVRVDYSGNRRVVEFKQGFYYDVMLDELRYVEEEHNAFVSVLEPVDGARTAWGWHHPKIGEENQIFYLDEPGWIALVHDQNTTTYLWGDSVTARRKRAVLRQFEIARPPYLASRVRRLEALRGRAIRRARRAAHSLQERRASSRQ